MSHVGQFRFMSSSWLVLVTGRFGGDTDRVIKRLLL